MVIIGYTEDRTVVWPEGLPEVDFVLSPALSTECPLGVLCVAIMLLVKAWEMVDAELVDGLKTLSKRIMNLLPIHTIAASRWPIFETLEAWSSSPMMKLARSSIPQHDLDGIDCNGVRNSQMDWDDLRSHATAILNHRRNGVDQDTMTSLAAASPLKEETFSKAWSKKDAVFSHKKECPTGFAFISILQAITSANRFSGNAMSWFSELEAFIERTDLELIGLSKWPIFSMFAMMSDLNKQSNWFTGQKGTEKQRRLYGDLGMSVEELIPFGLGEHGDAVTEALARTPALVFREALAPMLRRHGASARVAEESRWSRIFGNSVRTALASQASAETQSGALGARKSVYLTHIWGTTWLPLLRPLVEHMGRLGVSNLVVATLDADAAAGCLAVLDRDRCWQHRGKGQLHRLTIMLQFLAFGIDVIYFDLDVFFFVNPAAAMFEQAEREGAQMLVSTHFDADCLNNGIMYVQASSVTYRWLLKLTSWYYHHTYENAQRGINVFLNHSQGVMRNGVSFLPEDIPAVRYGVLDGAVQFAAVCGKGWLGRLADMVAFHWCEASFDAKWRDLNALYGASASGSLADVAANVMEKYKLREEPVKRMCW
eukprot:TRINITY_DN26004_c0_g1_i1.p1 TRINITY_DN26004_c0_g1~~TRINITY_DN26004_c0_g1_i1.p1  ORF type:complete len:689 (-),score=137.69 TRINITY_DN26004_c0_g1_i1:18-1814(-)